MTLLIGTSNPGKQAELRALLSDFDLTTPEELGLALEIEEVHDNYAANAQLKARAYAERSGLWTIADDTGLEVDALDGGPGLYSARLGGSDEERRERLLEMLRRHPRPWTARFWSVVALADPRGETVTAKGYCEGEIVSEERGERGFGYDPIFEIAGTGLTMAEMSLEEKNRVSHRAQALKRLRPALEKL